MKRLWRQRKRPRARRRARNSLLSPFTAHSPLASASEQQLHRKMKRMKRKTRNILRTKKAIGGRPLWLGDVDGVGARGRSRKAFHYATRCVMPPRTLTGNTELPCVRDFLSLVNDLLKCTQFDA